jgi:hypothetical protein
MNEPWWAAPPGVSFGRSNRSGSLKVFALLNTYSSPWVLAIQLVVHRYHQITLKSSNRTGEALWIKKRPAKRRSFQG